MNYKNSSSEKKKSSKSVLRLFSAEPTVSRYINVEYYSFNTNCFKYVAKTVEKYKKYFV